MHGVDDGSGDLTDSLEMAQLAVQNGTKAIFATPHCNIPDGFENFMSDELVRRLSALQETLNDRGVDLTLYCGQEIFLADGFLHRLRKGELITLNRSRYPLVEFDFYEQASDAYRKIEMLSSEGYVPIVAHPERYAFVGEDENAVRKLRSCGALIQLNSGSFKGSFGRLPAVIAENILHNQLADFVASDAHSQYSRTPDLSRAHEFVCENFSYEYADMLFKINPEKVINNYEIR